MQEIIESTIRVGVFFLILPFLTLPVTLSAQSSDSTVDEQYEEARRVAFQEGNYEKARDIAYSALDKSPDYHGIRIFIANLYSWEGRYDKAREEINRIFDRDTQNRRALTAIIDIESRSGNPGDALEWSDKAQVFYPQDQEFMLKKASVLNELENYQKAEEIYREILEIYPASVEARQGLQRVRLKQMKYAVTLSHRHDRFSEIFDPWSFWEFQLSRQTKYGSVIGRIQHANRFGSNGVQFNVDAYPSLFGGLYAYISGGYSEASIYPRYRFGFSLYKSLPLSLELEGGFRYLEFSASQTFIYTASLTKYWGNYLFTGRTYLVPYAGGHSQSLNLLVRRYFSDAETYVGISGGFGSASADIQFAEDIQRQDSWSVSVQLQYPLSKRMNIGGNVGFDSEEFRYFDRNRVSAKLSLSYRF